MITDNTNQTSQDNSINNLSNAGSSTLSGSILHLTSPEQTDQQTPETLPPTLGPSIASPSTTSPSALDPSMLDKFILSKSLSNTSIIVNDINNISNNIDEKLLMQYNLEYINNFNTIQQLNKEIMNKDQMISFNNYSFQQKNNNIYLLTITILLIIFIILVLVSSKLGVISNISTYILLSFGIIIYIIKLLKKFYWNQFTWETKAAQKFLEKAGKSASKTILTNILPDDYLQCPSNCKTLKEHTRHIDDDAKYIKDNLPSTNERYNIGEVTADLSKYNNKNKYFVCQFTGNKNEAQKNMGTNFKSEFISNIPCEYYPGYSLKK